MISNFRNRTDGGGKVESYASGTITHYYQLNYATPENYQFYLQTKGMAQDTFHGRWGVLTI